jgi:hypothetical protein
MQCIYVDDFVVNTPQELVQLENILNLTDSSSLLASVSCLSLSCTLQLAVPSSGSGSVELRISLPPTYPGEAPSVDLQHCSLRRSATSSLQQSCRGFIDSLAWPGEEVLLSLATHAGEELLRLVQEEGAAAAAASNACTPNMPLDERVGRAVVWFHHIKSSKKKASIAAWSGELSLRGFAKPGYPGVLFAEGAQGDVEEILRRMRSQRWKAMAVRAEEWSEVPHGESALGHAQYTTAAGWDGRHSIEFLQEGAMGVVAERFTLMGREGLFKRAVLKMAHVSASEGQGTQDDKSDSE